MPGTRAAPAEFPSVRAAELEREALHEIVLHLEAPRRVVREDTRGARERRDADLTVALLLVTQAVLELRCETDHLAHAFLPAERSVGTRQHDLDVVRAQRGRAVGVLLANGVHEVARGVQRSHVHDATVPRTSRARERTGADLAHGAASGERHGELEVG